MNNTIFEDFFFKNCQFRHYSWINSYLKLLFLITVIDLADNSNEFTINVSRGKLKHPDCKLFDYSLYCFSFFKNKTKKCCSKLFLEAFKYIYTTIGYDFKNIDSINSRFINCFFKGLVKKDSEDIRNNKSLEALRKKTKTSWYLTFLSFSEYTKIIFSFVCNYICIKFIPFYLKFCWRGILLFCSTILCNLLFLLY